MKNNSIDIVNHEALSTGDVDKLRRLFNEEYIDEFGPWDLEEPYGYAGHEVHVIPRSGSVIIGHVGWAYRLIRVGGSEVVIAGVGGMLVSSQVQGSHIGRRLMREAVRSMSDAGGVNFGYLGCREEVVPFYLSCGWHRISAAEQSVSRSGLSVVAEPGPPLLILPIDCDLVSWPEGTIDLRGRAWWPATNRAVEQQAREIGGAMFCAPADRAADSACRLSVEYALAQGLVLV